jgi:hypothetical protein
LVAAALHPDPGRRPHIREIIGCLGGERPPAQAPAAGVADDPFTLPLALASQGEADATTAPVTGRTPVGPDEPFDQERFPDAAYTRRLPSEGDDEPAAELEEPDDLPVDLAPVPRRQTAALAVRRGLVLVALALVVGAVTAAWPYWALALVLGVSWLLRTCTMTVTAHGDRRRLRGARWYDVLVAPLSAPWYLVAAIPGALLLGVWAVGVGVAGALLCYAMGISTSATLFVTGLCVVGGLWLGPGAPHVRWPVRVVAHAVARRTGRWAVLTVMLLSIAGFVGHQASLDVGWSPFGRPPLVGR